MGEWSKHIGDTGENTVGRLLEMIGWKPRIANYDVPCSFPAKHGNKADAQHRREHGLDGSFMYRCPLVDGTQQHVVISVKYSNERYPTEGRLGTTFGKHYRSLSQMCVCYKKAPRYAELTASDEEAERFPVSGALFWLNHSAEDDASSICPSLVSIRPDAEPAVPIYLVDNNQAAFLYDSIAFIHREFGQAFTFNYQPTGKNLDSRTRQHFGGMLPIHLINSAQLVFRVESPEKLLVICSKNSFSEADLKRLFDLAQYLSLAFVSRVVIAFRVFDAMRDNQVVQKVKQMFVRNDGLRNVDVHSLEGDFRNEGVK